MAESMDWRSLWRTADVEDFAHDLVGELRSAMAHGVVEPDETMGIAAAAAESCAALPTALRGSDWAIRTPWEVAAAAAAAFAMAESAVEALRGLTGVLQHMEARGDLASHTVVAATSRLTAAADELSGFVHHDAEQTVAHLIGMPSAAPAPPANVHETLVAVATMLGDLATLNNRENSADHIPDGDNGFGCGCDVEIEYKGDSWNFARGDSTWSLLREKDGQKLSDGSTVFPTSYELPAASAVADPRQLTEQLLRELADWASEADDDPDPSRGLHLVR